eukprot:1138969-Pelagomonas_calceolata.AAC.2
MQTKACSRDVRPLAQPLESNTNTLVLPHPSCPAARWQVSGLCARWWGANGTSRLQCPCQSCNKIDQKMRTDGKMKRRSGCLWGANGTRSLRRRWRSRTVGSKGQQHFRAMNKTGQVLFHKLLHYKHSGWVQASAIELDDVGVADAGQDADLLQIAFMMKETVPGGVQNWLRGGM